MCPWSASNKIDTWSQNGYFLALPLNAPVNLSWNGATPTPGVYIGEFFYSKPSTANLDRELGMVAGYEGADFDHKTRGLEASHWMTFSHHITLASPPSAFMREAASTLTSTSNLNLNFLLPTLLNSQAGSLLERKGRKPIIRKIA